MSLKKCVFSLYTEEKIKHADFEQNEVYQGKRKGRDNLERIKFIQKWSKILQKKLRLELGLKMGDSELRRTGLQNQSFFSNTFLVSSRTWKGKKFCVLTLLRTNSFLFDSPFTASCQAHHQSERVEFICNFIWSSLKYKT